MSTGDTHLEQVKENNPSSKVLSKADVWDYFEKIIGDDGLQKARCKNCNKVYSCGPKSGTSTLRRHLRKCSPQPLNQVSPEAIQIQWSNTDDLAHDTRASKKLKYDVEDLRLKTDRELLDFVWMNKRNIGLLEQKFPDKAVTIKKAIKSYEKELNRRAKIQSPKENSPGGTNIVAVKIVEYNQIGGDSVDEGESTGIHADMNQVENGNVPLKDGVSDQSVPENRNITEEERAGGLQIVAFNGNENQADDICTELRKVSSVLSLLTTPNRFYIPKNNPLDEKTKQAKESLIQLLKKDFKTLVGSPEEETIKSCIEILIKNLDKLPKIQGRVIETLHTEFESACQNWSMWHKNIEENIACEVKQGDTLEILQEWQEKDVEIESKIMKVDADIERLKDELREKELTKESLVKRKFDLFNESKISIGEAKKILEEMVSVKVRSDVAIDNMNDLTMKWERFREDFLFT